jgi:hypothetical protein
MRIRPASCAEAAAVTSTAAVFAVLLGPEPAAAHGLVGRADLPIPAWLFGWAAAVVLVVSFLGLATLWKDPQLEEDNGMRPLPAWLSLVVVNRVTETLAGVVGVGLLALTIWSGLGGVQRVEDNFAPTFVYVVFWVGLVPASIVFGDVFRALNPWRAIGRVGEAVARRVTGRTRPPFAYPDRLGRWPAVAGVAGFAWLELAHPSGDDPSTLAAAALVYTLVTLGAMACFGTEPWTRRGEAFSVYFNLFARLSPLTVRRGRLGLRRPLSGLAALEPAPGTVALLVVMIGSVMFDGASEGEPWTSAGPHLEDAFLDVGFGLTAALSLTATVGMLLAFAVVYAIYTVGVSGVRAVDPRPRVRVARSFVHTLIPIAAVYVLAHYFSLLAYNGQSMAHLLSDPLGRGWDLFSTAGSTVDYGVVGATSIWYVQVAVLVAGHVCGLVLAHDRGLALYGRAQAAATSQYWMLAVMVAFTTFGLFLLSQANQ